MPDSLRLPPTLSPPPQMNDKGEPDLYLKGSMRGQRGNVKLEGGRIVFPDGDDPHDWDNQIVECRYLKVRGAGGGGGKGEGRAGWVGESGALTKGTDIPVPHLRAFQPPGLR